MVSHETLIKVSPSTRVSSEGSTMLSGVVGRIQLSGAGLTEGSGSGGDTPGCWPRGCPPVAACIGKASESASETEVVTFNHLIPEVTASPCCHDWSELVSHWGEDDTEVSSRKQAHWGRGSFKPVSRRSFSQ